MKQKMTIWTCGLLLCLSFSNCLGWKSSDKGAESDSAAEANANVEKTEDKSVTDDGDANELSKQSDKLFDDWQTRLLNVDAAGGNVNIHAFAKAVCQEFSSFEPCAKIVDYLKNPVEFKKTEEVFYVEDHPKNGYINCDWKMQISKSATLCYWNRKNGHQLVAVALEDGHETNSASKYQYMFYDYDKSSGKLTPDTEVSKIFDNFATRYDDIYLHLPKEGKDMQVLAFTYGDDDESEDDDSLDYFVGKWDGMTFSIVPSNE